MEGGESMESQITKEMLEVKEALKQCVTKDVYEKDMAEVKTTLKEHSEAIEEVKATLKEHGEAIEEIKATLKKHDEEIAEIKVILKEHGEAIVELQKDVKELKDMMKSFQRTMLIVEDAVTNKIPALFDGYSMHQQKQEELENKVDRLNQTVETHSIRIAALETISSNDANRLSKISS